MTKPLLVWSALWPAVVAAQAFAPGQGSQPGALDGGADIQSASLYCKNCHNNENASPDPDNPEPLPYAPVDTWASTMMANSVRDPLFRAALSVANQDVADVGQWCLRCHAPQAYWRGHTLPADGGAFDAVDNEGVTCDVCHRSHVPSQDANAPYIGNAQIFVDATGLKFGPYDDSSSPFHPTAKSSFTSSSALCGQCHQVFNPILPWRASDGGVLAPHFPLDTTYEEWKQSAFARGTFADGARSCQNCHMPAFEGSDGGIAAGPTADGGWGYPVAKMGPYRAQPQRHTFAGGNVWGLDAVLQANPDLQPLAAQFAETKRWAMKNLNEAATLALTVPADGYLGEASKVTVKVTNHTGHKLPTGYADGRRVFVQLEVDGVVLSGAFTDAGTVLPGGQPLRVYEAVHGRAGSGPGEHLALHDTIVKDSRIPPQGFQATLLTAPVGVDWFNAGDGGYLPYDEASFVVPLNGKAPGSTVNVTARLFMQTTTPEYVHFLAEENRTDDAGQVLKGVFDALGGAPPLLMAERSASFRLSDSPQGTGGGQSGQEGHGPAACGCHAAAGGLWLFGLALLALGRAKWKLPRP